MNAVEKTVELLMMRGWKISLAESCTGGLATARLVDVPNASRILDAAVVTYANEQKERYLGVRPQTIAQYGVVSEPVVREMAEGVAARNGAQVGIGISGVAGPGGGTTEKPVGTVCFGFFVNGETKTLTRRFGNIGRNAVRCKSVDFVFEQLVEMLENQA
ncbi:MAG: CinA family protein [Clostridia bacterium]|nr:CinA family protein [Clostridia bacterium]